MLAWIKKLRGLVRNYGADTQRFKMRVQQLEESQRCLAQTTDLLEKLIRDRTDIAVDMHADGSAYAIVVGHYKNADYVQTYRLCDSDMGLLVEQLRRMQRFAHLRQVDAPPNISAVVKRAAQNWR